jgi:Glycosyl hydrolases family 28
MRENVPSNLSRRNWMGLAAAPVLAGVVEAALHNGTARAESAAAVSVGITTSDSAMVGARVFNVRDFGAKGDGKTLDTAAIQAAIDACTKNQGGIVLVPGGEFLIGPIELKSNVTLHISADGKLVATADKDQYHPAEGIPLNGDATMQDGNVGLLYGANATNVTIEGPGTIDGQGKAVRDGGLGGIRRPHLLLFYKCTNLVIRDVYMYQSAYHAIRICNSQYICADGIRLNSRVASNNDGFHFISCSYVNITNCNFRCGDDACALFGSCQYIMVSNCSFSTRWSVFRFGGGQVKNIAVTNCIMQQVLGCPIKIRCGRGSVFENMSFSNLVFDDVSGPISIGAGGGRRGTNPNPATASVTDKAEAETKEGKADEQPERETRPPAVIRNVTFSNISGTVLTKQTPLDDSTMVGLNRPGEQHSCIVLNCLKEATMENISFSDIRLMFGGGGTAEDAARRELPQIAGEYFELGPLPAYGLYARNMRGLSVNNVRFQTATPDLRPALILDNVTDAAISGLSAQGNSEAESVLRFINAAETLVTAPRLLTPAAVFLRVEGGESREIVVDGGDISKAGRAVAHEAGAAEKSVKLRA